MSDAPVIVSTTLAPAALGPYSQAIRHGGFVWCAGQLGLDPVTGQMVGPTVEAQTVQVIQNLSAVLGAGGSALDRVVKTTVYLQDMNDFAKMNAVYAQFFGGSCPARATVQVARLPKDALVEIDAVGACT